MDKQTLLQIRISEFWLSFNPTIAPFTEGNWQLPCTQWEDKMDHMPTFHANFPYWQMKPVEKNVRAEQSTIGWKQTWDLN